MIIDHDIYYSVEWIPKDDTFNCWNQHALTRSRILASLLMFEAKSRLGRANNRFRIREV